MLVIGGINMSYKKCDYKNLKELCNNVFERFGYNKEDSNIITDVLLMADLYGIESHGIQRLVLYYNGIKNGRIKVNSKMKVIKETPLSVLVDGNKEMGQLVSKNSMDIAINKAKIYGFGMAVVKNSNHFGISGYYAKMAADQGFIGISMTNTQAVVLPTYSKRRMLGTNPIAISMPAKPIPFLLDMSTSVVTRGKMEVYSKNNEPIPEGWALDEEGKIITDSKKIIEITDREGLGGILPLGGHSEKFGGHKGYGLGLAVEMFTSILSGGFTSDNVRFSKDVDGVSHTFIAIDYGMFGDKNEIEKRMSDYMQKLRDSEKVQGASRIYTHGEKEIEAYNDRIKNGIPVNQNTIKEIEDICDYLKLDIARYK